MRRSVYTVGVLGVALALVLAGLGYLMAGVAQAQPQGAGVHTLGLSLGTVHCAEAPFCGAGAMPKAVLDCSVAGTNVRVRAYLPKPDAVKYLEMASAGKLDTAHSSWSIKKGKELIGTGTWHYDGNDDLRRWSWSPGVAQIIPDGLDYISVKLAPAGGGAPVTCGRTL